jgi:hypothetical protein
LRVPERHPSLRAFLSVSTGDTLPWVRGRRRRGHKSGGRSCQTRGGARSRSP